MEIRAPGTARGVTLIELLVAVAIIAILAAIGMPMYKGYATRGRIPEATSGLSAKRVRMETYYDNNRTYKTIPECQKADEGQYFTFECLGLDNRDKYTLRAKGKGSMDGFSYEIDQDNKRQTTSVPPGWTKNTSCWVTKEDGTC